MSNMQFVFMTFLASTHIAYAEMPSNLTPLNAEFVTSQCDVPCKNQHTRGWKLIRDNNQVEIRDINLTTGELASKSEIWKHIAKDKLTYLFVMHNEKRAIEYLFDDLKVLNLASDDARWQLNNQLITNNEFSSLKLTNQQSEAFNQYKTVNYEGVINDAKVSLRWITDLRIPAEINYQYPDYTVNVVLKKIDTINTAQIMTTTKTLSNYQQVYFTDIGDMEQNPDAQEWIAKAKGAPGMHSHQH
jgi:hypothetical protein